MRRLLRRPTASSSPDNVQRRSSLRTSLLLLVLVPFLALLAIWLPNASDAYNDAMDLNDAAGIAEDAGLTTYELMGQLQEERRLSGAWLSEGTADARTALEEQRGRTDAAVDSFRAASEEALNSSNSRVVEDTRTVLDDLAEMSAQRALIDERSSESGPAAAAYVNRVIDHQIHLFQELTNLDSAPEVAEGGRSMVALFRATELLSREDAVISSGRIDARVHQEFIENVGVRRHLHAIEIEPMLTGGEREAFAAITGSPEWQAIEATEDAVLARGISGDRATPLPSEADEWRDAIATVGPQLADLNRDRLASLVRTGDDGVQSTLLSTALLTALGLVAVVISVLLSLRISRSLMNRLDTLRRATVELAEERLPDVVSRLRRGEQVDVEAATAELPTSTDELGRVAAAFNSAQHTAVETAVQLARLRDGTTGVFVNIAHRMQALLHRQLSMLDEAQRRHEDPAYLAELYAVDHLTTRMRRNTESLAVLGGVLPRRRWRRPVPVVDVLRSAVAETEHYARVNVGDASTARLAGPAVGDTIHLIAELVENATVFSPADTRVTVNAETIPHGVVIEIEDRGLGMPREAYDAANALLASPPEFDLLALDDDPRIGLFVVSRLAARHGINVTLRRSAYGGTRAIVLLPPSLLESNAQAPAGAGAGRPAAPAEPQPQHSHAEPVLTGVGAGAPGGGAVATGPESAPVPGPRLARRRRERGTMAAVHVLPGADGEADGSARHDRGNGDHQEGSRRSMDHRDTGSVGPRHRAERREAERDRADAPPAVPPAAPPGIDPEELPRRVRQRSLAAGLREDPPVGSSAGGKDAGAGGRAEGGQGDEPTVDRSPDRARSSMAAFQQQSRRARDARLPEPPTRDE
ncbi:sensor histidine kinase [Allostreptomyces psammosilenae]|uniref:histidine kinase n=1 Tax=Allostreptomyces psammosilenae TaxID=1892865 RepID=A0A853AD36_9ACTN|nr:nitrate- and nitrite sensing domain-containing protein [Allostreptomyces psammosilenae]NYI08358.1 signal transduction histidine kinase/F0F1-type ATP synthase membrane subunit b/b' [Allostreptomyces psammosilenae]